MGKTTVPEDYTIMSRHERAPGWRFAVSTTSRRDIRQVMAQFPTGSLVTIQWVSYGAVYDVEEYGTELNDPEPALLLKHIPEYAFKNNPKGWVVPFECLYNGMVRVSTTYATEMIGKISQLGEKRK